MYVLWSLIFFEHFYLHRWQKKLNGALFLSGPVNENVFFCSNHFPRKVFCYGFSGAVPLCRKTHKIFFSSFHPFHFPFYLQYSYIRCRYFDKYQRHSLTTNTVNTVKMQNIRSTYVDQRMSKFWHIFGCAMFLSNMYIGTMQVRSTLEYGLTTS
jgi:hypothetical protein